MENTFSVKKPIGTYTYLVSSKDDSCSVLMKTNTVFGNASCSKIFNMSAEDMCDALTKYCSGSLVQDAFVDLSPNDREWFLTGSFHI